MNGNGALPTTALEMATQGHDIGVQQLLRMRLDLFQESIVATAYKDGRPITAYEVSAEDLAAAFSGQALVTPLLPPDCLAYARAGGQEMVVVYLRPGKRELVAHTPDGLRRAKIPLPGFVFAGRGTSYRIFAIPARPKHMSETLYQAPLPNVYPEGEVCAGTVAFPTCSPTSIMGAAQLFFESEFNGDLTQGKAQRYRTDVRELWWKIDGQAHFPDGELLRSPVSLHSLITEVW